MYGLRQAARLAYDDFKKHLAKHRYHPDPIAQKMLETYNKKNQNFVCVLTILVSNTSTTMMHSI